MSNGIEINADPKHSEYLLKSLAMNLEAGTLGKFFGSKQSAASSIAWIISFLLIAAGIVFWFVNGSTSGIEYFKTAGPFITLPLGYLFGNK